MRYMNTLPSTIHVWTI